MKTHKRRATVEVKPACDHLATVHRDSQDLASRFGGERSGTVVYVTRDPLVVNAIDRVLGIAPLALGAIEPKVKGVKY